VHEEHWQTHLLARNFPSDQNDRTKDRSGVQGGLIFCAKRDVVI